MTTEQKLQKLRKLWLKADSKMKKVIEARAKLLKMGVNPDGPVTIEEAEVIFSGSHQTSLKTPVQ